MRLTSGSKTSWASRHSCHLIGQSYPQIWPQAVGSDWKMNERSKSKWFLAFSPFLLLPTHQGTKSYKCLSTQIKNKLLVCLKQKVYSSSLTITLNIWGAFCPVLRPDSISSLCKTLTAYESQPTPLSELFQCPPIMTANWTGSTGNDLCFEVVLGPLSKMDEELSHSGGLFLLYITSSQLRCFMNIRRFYLNCFSAINTIPLKWGIVFIANDQETSG